MPRCALVLLLSLLLGGCGAPPDADQAETTYGTPVDATEAHPAPAVAAESSLYADRPLTVEGRITAVRASGCEIHLATEATLLIVIAARTDAGDCAWQVPTDAQGVAVAAGTLRIAGDTLRLTANGVRVTPVRVSNPDS